MKKTYFWPFLVNGLLFAVIWFRDLGVLRSFCHSELGLVGVHSSPDSKLRRRRGVEKGLYAALMSSALLRRRGRPAARMSAAVRRKKCNAPGATSKTRRQRIRVTAGTPLPQDLMFGGRRVFPERLQAPSRRSRSTRRWKPFQRSFESQLGLSQPCWFLRESPLWPIPRTS